MTDLDPIQPAPPTSPLSDPTYVFVGADGLRAGWSILVFITLCFILSTSASFLAAKVRHKPYPPQQTAAKATNAPVEEQSVGKIIFGEGASFLLVLLATYIMAKIERRPFTRFGFGGTNRLPQFLQGFVWGAVCLSLLIAILYFAGYLRFDARLLSNTDALKYGVLWTIGAIFIGCLEESLTRGYLQYTFARGLAGLYGAIFQTRHRHALGFWTAALILSTLFGLSHGHNPGESPLGLAAAGSAGLVFCLALYRTGSLWWAIGFHASWDWAQSFVYGVADSGTMVEHHLYATHPVGPTLLSGGSTGPEGSIFVLAALLIAAVIIVLTVPKTHHPGEGLSHPDTL